MANRNSRLVRNRSSNSRSSSNSNNIVVEMPVTRKKRIKVRKEKPKWAEFIETPSWEKSLREGRKE